MSSGVKAVSTVASLDFPCLFAQPGLVTPDHQGQVMIILQNCGDEDITIPRCSSIGYIENVNNPCFDEISEVKQKEWEAQISENPKLPEPEPMSNEEKENFLAQAKINVPVEEKLQYKDLLCKHHDVFSKDKTDMGMANNVEHKIDLKVDNPVYVKQF